MRPSGLLGAHFGGLRTQSRSCGAAGLFVCCAPVPSHEHEATADMANNPKKLKEPTDTALTAIQEVLNTPDAPNLTAGEPIAPRDAGRRNPRPSVADGHPFEGGTNAIADEDLRPARPAANDDRQSIGQILQTLQRRPPRTSYWVASIFALAWVVGGL